MLIPNANSQLENVRRSCREMTPTSESSGIFSSANNQRIVGRFIVDSYCASAKLVVEVDGFRDYEPHGTAYDSERSAFLIALGLWVLRFFKRDVDGDFCGVCT